MSTLNALIAATNKFINTVEATGGVVGNHRGWYEPCADREWIDLGDAYVACCSALGIKPMVANQEPDDEEEPDT